MARRTYQQVVAENRRLAGENRGLRRRVRQLEAEVERWKREAQEARRAAKRQAAPFSKGNPKRNPKKPGRRPGRAYGRRGSRPVPRRGQIDEVYEAVLPPCCPHCAGQVKLTEVKQQYQVEIPRRPIHRQFNVHIGRCEGCGRRVQGHHKLQTSDALGAARVQLGSELQAGIVDFNKVAGLSYGKIQRALQSLFGIEIARSTACRVVLRAGTRLQPVYEEIKSLVAAADQVGPDETGWRVGGEKAWLHTLATEAAVLYVVAASRGGEVVEAVLGLEYSGTLVHDGWAPYDRFEQANHQQCLNHLLERCKELLETATRGAVRFPRQVQSLLEKGLETRDRHEAGEISDHGLAVACGRLDAGLAAVVGRPKSNPDNERLAAFLRSHEDQIFTFLRIPGTDATNWRAEQAIRVAVVNRKVWGGNRTAQGGQAQSVLMSVVQTCIRRGGDAISFVSRWLRGDRARLPSMARGP